MCLSPPSVWKPLEWRHILITLGRYREAGSVLLSVAKLVVCLSVLIAWLVLRGKALSDLVVLNYNLEQQHQFGGAGHYEAVRLRVRAPAAPRRE